MVLFSDPSKASILSFQWKSHKSILVFQSYLVWLLSCYGKISHFWLTPVFTPFSCFAKCVSNFYLRQMGWLTCVFLFWHLDWGDTLCGAWKVTLLEFTESFLDSRQTCFGINNQFCTKARPSSCWIWALPVPILKLVFNSLGLRCISFLISIQLSAKGSRNLPALPRPIHLLLLFSSADMF